MAKGREGGDGDPQADHGVVTSVQPPRDGLLGGGGGAAVTAAGSSLVCQGLHVIYHPRHPLHGPADVEHELGHRKRVRFLHERPGRGPVQVQRAEALLQREQHRMGALVLAGAVVLAAQVEAQLRHQPDYVLREDRADQLIRLLGRRHCRSSRSSNLQARLLETLLGTETTPYRNGPIYTCRRALNGLVEEGVKSLIDYGWETNLVPSHIHCFFKKRKKDLFTFTPINKSKSKRHLSVDARDLVGYKIII